MKNLLEKWMEMREIDQESLVLAFMPGDLPYAITNVSGYYRFYRAGLEKVFITPEQAEALMLPAALSALLLTSQDEERIVVGRVGKLRIQGLTSVWNGYQVVTSGFNYKPLADICRVVCK